MIRRTCTFVAPLIFLALAQSAAPDAAAKAQGTAADAPAKQSTPEGAKGAPSAVAPVAAVSSPKGTRLTWLGHAAWMLRSPKGTTVLIDPWLENPKQPKDFALPEHLDAIVITHGHADHVGEAVRLAEKFQVPVVASFELIETLGIKDGIGANPGGMVAIKDIEMHLTQAVHSSSVAQSRPLPPPQSEIQAVASGDESTTCTCPDHSKCPPSHHHGQDPMAQGPGAAKVSGGDHDHDEAHRSHGKQGKHSHKNHHHKHDSASKHHFEAPELVLGEGVAARGPKEAAVDEGITLAQGHGAAAHDAEPLSGAQEGGAQTAPCHCGPDHDHPKGAQHKAHLHYAGAAMGVIFKVELGPTVFHAGDTDVFLDMGLIKRRYEPEVALLPIGGHYTMGPKDAALAASLLGAHDVVPMHYGTSPELSGTPDELRRALDDDMRVVAPSPGATISYPERKPS